MTTHTVWILDIILYVIIVNCRLKFYWNGPGRHLMSNVWTTWELKYRCLIDVIIWQDQDELASETAYNEHWLYIYMYSWCQSYHLKTWIWHQCIMCIKKN